MKTALKDVKANPFRNISHYPINRDKIEALKNSIQTTEFWDNIVARKNGPGVEIAYGHHRLEALRQLYATSHKVELIVRKLDDAQMLRIMANENMTEWQHDASIEQETVRAVVKAYGDGKIELEKPEARAAQVRLAPTFQTIDGTLKRTFESPIYTVNTIAQFLGWTTPGKLQKVRDALIALAQQEQGLLDAEDFTKLSSKQAQGVVRQVTRIKKSLGDSIASQVGKKLAKGFRDEEVTIHNVRPRATALAKQVVGKKPQKPDIQYFVGRLAERVKTLHTCYHVDEKLDEAVKNRTHIPTRERKELIAACRSLSKIFSHYADEFEEEI